MVDYHRKKDESRANAKSKNTERSDIPPLSVIFALSVQHSISTSSWRSPIKKYFSDMEDLQYLLLLLEKWFSQWAVHDLSVLSRVDSRLEKLPKSQIITKYEKLPHIDNVSVLIQNVFYTTHLGVFLFVSLYPFCRPF